MRGETSRVGTKPVARECAVEGRLGGRIAKMLRFVRVVIATYLLM